MLLPFWWVYFSQAEDWISLHFYSLCLPSLGEVLFKKYQHTVRVEKGLLCPERCVSGLWSGVGGWGLTILVENEEEVGVGGDNTHPQ